VIKRTYLLRPLTARTCRIERRGLGGGRIVVASAVLMRMAADVCEQERLELERYLRRKTGRRVPVAATVRWEKA
jgi:hypothetical protein